MKLFFKNLLINFIRIAFLVLIPISLFAGPCVIFSEPPSSYSSIEYFWRIVGVIVYLISVASIILAIIESDVIDAIETNLQKYLKIK